jgi:signal peptide peptidase SppA
MTDDKDIKTFVMREFRLHSCAATHFGPWMIEPEWFASACDAISRGMWQAATPQPPAGPKPDDTPYPIVGGVAVIAIEGAMMKSASKFGGASTVALRSQIRRAANDSRVNSIMLLVDSPGGTVAGTEALAQDVAAANRMKPVHAHIEDMGASAAYYVASQAGRVTAGTGSLIGSLGTRLTIVDSSGMAEKEGLKVHAIASGEYKAAGEGGTQITERQLAYFRGIVDDATTHFKAAVMRGREMDQSTVDALFDGRVHDAQTAKQLGLIDDVSTLDTAVAAISQKVNSMNADAFNAYAAEHPEAVAGFIEQGQKQGYANAKADLRSVVEAVPGKPQLAIDSFLADLSAEQAKVTAGAIDQATAAQQAEANRLQQEIGRLQAQVGTQGAVATGIEANPAAATASTGDPLTREQATAQAKDEWQRNSEDCQASFVSEGVYVAYRVRKLTK